MELNLIDEQKKPVARVFVQDPLIPRKGDHFHVRPKDKKEGATYEVVRFLFTCKDFTDEKDSSLFREDYGAFAVVRPV